MRATCNRPAFAGELAAELGAFEFIDGTHWANLRALSSSFFEKIRDCTSQAQQRVMLIGFSGSSPNFYSGNQDQEWRVINSPTAGTDKSPQLPLTSFAIVKITFAKVNFTFAKANFTFAKANFTFVKANFTFAKANYTFVKANYTFVKANFTFAKANFTFVKANFTFAKANFSSSGQRDRQNQREFGLITHAFHLT